MLAVEDEGEIVLTIGQRAIVAACFARYFDGTVLDGPPWRVDPTEPLPTRDEWVESMAVFS